MPARTRSSNRLGLRTEEQRAWATYDWANSAFQCTIITAVFPVYFASVAAADLPPAVATERFAASTTLALAIIAVLAPVLGAYADVAGAKKRVLAMFPGHRRRQHGGDGADRPRRLAAGRRAVHRRQHRRQRQLRLLRLAAAPHRARRRDGSRVECRLRARIFRRGACCWREPGVDPQTRMVRPGGCRIVASRLSFLSVAVWWLVFAIPLFRKVPEPAGAASAQHRHANPMHRRSAARRHAARTAPVPAGLPDARRISDLQRRHRHDHPDGGHLRPGDRPDREGDRSPRS